MVSAPPVSDPMLAGLDAGEKEAIGLAVKTKAGLVLLDEAFWVAGDWHARSAGSPRADLIDVADAVSRLRKTSFRASLKLYQLLLGPATKPATTRHKNEPKTGSTTREQQEGSD
jgi:hypothetical protein